MVGITSVTLFALAHATVHILRGSIRPSSVDTIVATLSRALIEVTKENAINKLNSTITKIAGKSYHGKPEEITDALKKQACHRNKALEITELAKKYFVDIGTKLQYKPEETMKQWPILIKNELAAIAPRPPQKAYDHIMQAFPSISLAIFA